MRAYAYHYTRLLRQRQSPYRSHPRYDVHVTPSRHTSGWGWQVSQGRYVLSRRYRKQRP